SERAFNVGIEETRSVVIHDIGAKLEGVASMDPGQRVTILQGFLRTPLGNDVRNTQARRAVQERNLWSGSERSVGNKACGHAAKSETRLVHDIRGRAHGVTCAHVHRLARELGSKPGQIRVDEGQARAGSRVRVLTVADKEKVAPVMQVLIQPDGPG